MNVWVRRSLLVLIVLFWLAVILTPTLAFVLARNGQVQLGRSDGRHIRLFLVQGDGAEGLSLERARPIPPPVDGPASLSCLQTSVNYWMWSGEGQPVTYCQCVDTTIGQMTGDTPPACLTP